jgi:hypothetical protein
MMLLFRIFRSLKIAEYPRVVHFGLINIHCEYLVFEYIVPALGLVADVPGLLAYCIDLLLGNLSDESRHLLGVNQKCSNQECLWIRGIQQ